MHNDRIENKLHMFKLYSTVKHIYIKSSTSSLNMFFSVVVLKEETNYSMTWRQWSSFIESLLFLFIHIIICQYTYFVSIVRPHLSTVTIQLFLPKHDIVLKK